MAISNPSHVQGNGRHNLVPDTSEGQDKNEDDSYVPKCGIGRFKPKLLRVCANMSVFTGIYSFSAFMTSTLSAYVNSQVTTLEKHFGFNSSQTGLIMAANDVGFLFIILFISYMATKVHIPRALGLFTILFGVSGITCALPYFLFGAPSPSSATADGSSNVSAVTSAKASRGLRGQLCDGVNHTSMSCDVIEKPGQTEGGVGAAEMARAHAGTALIIIVLGMVLQGVAKTPRSAFTTFYVDSNVDKLKTGFYMGIIITIAIMGPATAFGLGGMFSRIYVTLEDTDMHYRHPNWIGAWWLGYLTFGCAACLVALPLFCFPRRIKRDHQKTEPAPSRQPDRVNALHRTSELLKGFLAAMIRLWTNPVYICTVLSTCTLLFAVAGGQSFTPKYIENQFAFPAWKANMAMAGVLMGTACLGTFVGGYLTKRLKMGPMASLKFTVAAKAISVVFKAVLIAFKCEQPYLYNSPGPRASAETQISGCLEDCACDDTDYFPVCAEDGRNFFSPCHAGCHSTANGLYINCTCIDGGGTAIAGMSDYSCAMFYPFIVVFCLGTLASTLSIIPQLLVYIRAVEERDKAMALGFSAFMTSTTGWMLGPICFGKLIDDICIQWERSCGASGGGACRLYDNDLFRWKLLGYQVIFRSLAVGFLLLAYIAARVTKKFECREEKEENGKDTACVSLANGDREPDKASSTL